MNSRLTCKIVLISSLISTLASFASFAQQQQPVQLKLLTYSWLFNTSHAAQSTLTAQTPQASLAAPTDVTKGFTVKFSIALNSFDGEQTLVEIPQVLTVCLRQHDPKDRRRQNYPAFKLSDGSVPVLEASILLQSPTDKTHNENMTIGIPLAMLKTPSGRHEVVLCFSGVRWTMYVDGQLLDNDFALGYPQWNKKNTWSINPLYVKEAAIYLPAIEPEKIEAQSPKTASNIQYWTPEGHNTWVGDVVSYFYKGRYHLFYLFDRREHGSKFGRGGHYFEHLSTIDFKTWIEHEPATTIDEQWETFGTGTPFVFDNKLCISYGLHTTRIYPEAMTTLPQQWDYLNKTGATGSFNKNTTAGIPAGSTYSISEDGVSNFKKTGIMFHPCENPSVYTDPSGKLRMLANYRSKGMWESESIDGGWYCINPDFPLGGDCTFYFRWGKYDYILGGFDKLWQKTANAPESDYKECAAQGLDFYNGMSVPAITEISNGRFLLAGWIWMKGWGGALAMHELIQYADGRIGSKWMNEITPEIEKEKILAAKLSKTVVFPTDSQSFMLSFDVHPTKKDKGKFGILFLNEDGEQNACEWQVRVEDKEAQFAAGNKNNFSMKEKSLREGGSPQQARNYGIENLIDVEKPFFVRLLVKGTAKFGGSLIDAEIAGQRTMISYRPDLNVRDILFRLDGVELKNVRIAKLKE